MKLILLKEVESLGKEGDVVEVSDGHARNFLLPQNLAVPATQDAMNKRETREKNISRKAQKELAQAGDLAHRLEGHEVVLVERMSEGGKLFGSISAKAIVSALKKDGFKVDAGSVQIKMPIKEPGEYEVTIALPHGFEAEIRVVVESK
jgi:large subunit ribosomal protein L9